MRRSPAATSRSTAGAINEADPIERGVAMVFQNYALYPHMTVEQNIGFSLSMAGLSKQKIAEQRRRRGRNTAVEPLLKRKPAQLSGGQRQRVAIGRAIVREPEVFLFDEPLSNLDAELRVSMRVEIAKLHRRIGATMIYVTHDQTEAMTLADNIVVLRNGKIEQTGTPDTLYEDPANLFVAGFIGSPRMNFLDGTRTPMALSGSIAALSSRRVFCTAKATSRSRPASGPSISPSRRAGGAIDLKVDVVENLGGTRFIYGTLSSGQDVVIEAPLRDHPRPGETVTAGFQHEGPALRRGRRAHPRGAPGKHPSGGVAMTSIFSGTMPPHAYGPKPCRSATAGSGPWSSASRARAPADQRSHALGRRSLSARESRSLWSSR